MKTKTLLLGLALGVFGFAWAGLKSNHSKKAELAKQMKQIGYAKDSLYVASNSICN